MARVVALARESGMPSSALRGGGHSMAGHSDTDDGIVLDLRDLDHIEIDAEAGRPGQGPGARPANTRRASVCTAWRPGFGDTGSVGIGGITLSGGIGYLVRKHGLTIDT